MIVVDDSLFLCSTSCSQECESTHYTGSISFSQIASQITNLLLSSKGDVITNDYVNAVELRHRVSHDVDLIYNINDLYDSTTFFVTKVNRFSAAASSFNNGFRKIMFFFVTVDITMLQYLVQTYQSTYNNTFKSSRQLATEYLVQATRNLQDLSNEMRKASKIFNSFYDAQQFYTSFYALLDKCVVSSSLAYSYISQVLLDESNNTSIEYSPDSFYNNDLKAKSCKTSYSNMMNSIKLIAPILSYASQKISQWLQENSQHIIYAAAANFLSVTHSTNSNDDSISRNAPDLWTLLECVECNITNDVLNYSMWIKLVENVIISPASEEISRCLSEYESTLNDVYEKTKHFRETTPTWMLGDILSFYSSNLRQHAQLLNTYTHSFITGKSTLQETLANVAYIVKFMSTNVTAINDKIASSAEQWLKDVVSWRNDIIASYVSTLNSIVSLFQFMPKNTNLTADVRAVSVWYFDTVLLDIIYYEDFPLLKMPHLISMFNNNLTTFLELYAANVTNVIMKNLVQTNIDYAQASEEEIQLISNEWSTRVDNLSNIINQFQSGFTIDDAFIRLEIF